MAVPKHRTSKTKRDKRRTHDKLEAPTLTKCTQCGEARLQHHACPECGTYKGRSVTGEEE